MIGLGEFRPGEPALDITYPTVPERSWNSIAWGNGVFVAVSSSGVIMSSSDGTDWITQVDDGKNYRAIAYGNNMFVVTTQNPNELYTSVDGTEWSYLGDVPSQYYVNTLRYDPRAELFILRGNPGRFGTSANLTTWQQHLVVDWLLDGTYVPTALYVEDRWVITGYHPDSGVARVAISDDGGSTWNVVLTTSANYDEFPLGDYYEGIILFVSTRGTLRSTDGGFTWDESLLSGFPSRYSDITVGDNGFLLLSGVVDFTGPDGASSIETSVDGITWKQWDEVSDYQSPQGWTKVAHGDGVFVAVSSSGNAPRIKRITETVTKVDLHLGNTPVERVYLGDTQVYGPPVASEYKFFRLLAPLQALDGMPVVNELFLYSTGNPGGNVPYVQVYGEGVYDPSAAVDGDLDSYSMWEDVFWGEAPSSLTVELPAPINISGYGIAAWDDTHEGRVGLRQWQLLGSNDESTWDLLDEQTGHTWTSNVTTKTFDL